MIWGLCESPITFNAIIDWSTALNNGQMQLREILDLEAMLSKGPTAEQVEGAEADDDEISESAAGPSFKEEEEPEEAPADSDGSIAPLSYLPNERSSGQDAIGNLLRSRPEQATPKLSSNMRPTLERVRGSLASTEAELSQALDFLGAAAEDKAERISEALARIGVGDPEDNQQGEGGPFVPTAGLHFVEKTALLTHTLDDLEALRRTAAQMPLAMPVRATHVSSGFGVRRDPFLNRPAFHSGVDFVAEAGSTVRATAPGIVVEAGWSGGYGEMVEIRHANGVSTRYGHLSEILVTVGAKVAAGAPIGRVGSTGRSTGPHLHYETRRDGNAVNPALYLAAGRAVRDPT